MNPAFANDRTSPASSAAVGRRLQMLESNSGPEIVLDGRTYVNFGGSCYLGMSSRADVIESGVDALRRYGAQSQIGRHYDVALPPNADAEREGALYFGTEASIYFASGYLIGLIALHGLSDRYDTVLIDEAAHLNLRDAGAPAATDGGRDLRVLFDVCRSGAERCDSLRSIFRSHRGANRPITWRAQGHPLSRPPGSGSRRPA